MNELVREMFRNYDSYKVSPQSYEVILNANENPINIFNKLPKEELIKLIEETNINRYPDSDSVKLREAYGNYINKKKEQILAGVGSDEVLRIIADIFLEADDYAVACMPTFEMYKTVVELAKGRFIGISPKNDDLTLDVDGLINAANENKAKLIFICTPNNPTGYLWTNDEIKKVLDSTSGMLIIDEAYIDFAEHTNIEFIESSKRVIVLRTMSKAFGLAGARVGFAIAHPEVINYLMLAKVPYNLSTFSQKAAQLLLENIDIVKEQIQTIKTEREYLVRELHKFSEYIKSFPTSSNFILISSDKTDEIIRKADEKNVTLRNFKEKLPNKIRISVGTHEENELVIQIMTEVFS